MILQTFQFLQSMPIGVPVHGESQVYGESLGPWKARFTVKAVCPTLSHPSGRG